MSLDTALFLVDRGGVNHHVTGANAYTVMQPGDKVLVQRGADIFQEVYRDPLPFDTIADDDLLLAWENNQTKHVTGATFKPLFIPPLPPLGEWNWIGHSTSTALYQMCDNGNQRYAFFKSNWGNLYFDHIDRNGQTAMHTKFRQSVENGDEIWFKVNNHPAAIWTDNFNPVLHFLLLFFQHSLLRYNRLQMNQESFAGMTKTQMLPKMTVRLER